MAIQPTQTDTLSASSLNKASTVMQVNQILPAKAQVSSNLLATLFVNGQQLNSQVTLLQSQQLLQQQLVAIVQQQNVSIYKQASLLSTSIMLLPAMAEQLQKELKQGFSAASKTILGLLAKELGVETPPANMHILKLVLTQNKLELEWLNQSPIVELKLQTNSPSPESADSLAKLLQWLIPISFNDKARVIVQQEEQHIDNNHQQSQLEFMMKFDLDQLGKMHISVCLNEFEMSTKTWIDNDRLLNKFETTWPILLERLEKLGFKCQSQVLPMSIEQQAETERTHSGLVNIKV